jgi:PAS domain S-box-containing protein
MAVTAVTSLAVAAGVVQQHRAEEAALQWGRYRALLAERQQAEDALAQAQAIAHLGSWRWDVAANRLDWSDELYRIHGVEPNAFDATYEAFLERVHPDDRELVEHIVQTAYEDLKSFDYYHRIVRPDGTVRTLHGRGAVIADESGKPALMVGTGHDVTELKMAEEEHIRLAAAQAAIAARDDFLSMAAHELKTPLTSMYGYVQLLARQQRTGKLESESLERGLALLESQSVKLTRLINDLLDVSRIESGRLELEPELCDLADIVTQSVAAAQARHLEREFVVRRPSTAEVVVDPLRVEQVVANLLDNAAKYSPATEPIEVELTKPSPGVFEIVVQDHGVGVPVAARERIFDRYFQAHVYSHSPGLGLGLYISRQIAELHGGTLTADFPPAGGSRFIVRLPGGAVGGPLPVSSEAPADVSS